jgi:hypothetical protein
MRAHVALGLAQSGEFRENLSLNLHRHYRRAASDARQAGVLRAQQPRTALQVPMSQSAGASPLRRSVMELIFHGASLRRFRAQSQAGLPSDPLGPQRHPAEVPSACNSPQTAFGEMTIWAEQTAENLYTVRLRLPDPDFG